MAWSLRHPYGDRPDTAFWKSGVAERSFEDCDPIIDVPFRISRTDKVAAAGSCFAQHLSKALIAEGIDFLQTEVAEPEAARKLPVFSARYGNIYTTRHLRQLFQRAYGLFRPKHIGWKRADGRYIDPFRPNEFEAGFASVEDVAEATRAHLAAVRRVFETCDVFVFTLGLTEVWTSDDDGAALPLPPGVVAAPEDGSVFSPHNLSVEAMTNDLFAVIDDIRTVNADIRFILTVSPVPLIATFHERHALVSNSYTKSALRVVAQQVSDGRPDVLYFPSYEMIAGHPKAHFYDDNFRAVRKEGVDAIMALFKRRVLIDAEVDVARTSEPVRKPPAAAAPVDASMIVSEFKDIFCDEDMLARE